MKELTEKDLCNLVQGDVIMFDDNLCLVNYVFSYMERLYEDSTFINEGVEIQYTPLTRVVNEEPGRWFLQLRFPLISDFYLIEDGDIADMIEGRSEE